MSDNIKLIIEIPKYYLECPQNYTCLAECVRRGTPLDDVLDKTKGYVEHIRNTGMGKKKSLNFIEKYIEGLKAEGIDPNDMTRMFDGVTEIPKDAFKGWYTDELLEQIRKENNDNPEDTGCDHND